MMRKKDKTIITSSGTIIRPNVEIALPKKSLDAFRRLLALGRQGKILGMNISRKNDAIS